jgi:hypothetical protein
VAASLNKSSSINAAEASSDQRSPGQQLPLATIGSLQGNLAIEAGYESRQGKLVIEADDESWQISGI